jgi:xanthine dehydrogenase accessory factor
MIGSRTKKAKFAHWFKAEGGDPEVLNRLAMPIGQRGLAGGKGTGDKRPEVIAVLAAAEIMVHIGGRGIEGKGARPVTGEEVDTVDGR